MKRTSSSISWNYYILLINFTAVRKQLSDHEHVVLDFMRNHFERSYKEQIGYSIGMRRNKGTLREPFHVS